VKKIVFICLGLYSFVFGTGYALFHVLRATLPPPSLIESYTPSLVTTVYDSKGNVIREFCEEKRILTSLTDVPKHFIDATLATEDQAFYSHWGFNLRGFVRAFIKDIKKGRRAEGGSSITQQLARDMFGLVKRKTYIRKLKELLLAIEIESKYSKDEILNMYLNQTLYGRGAYGVEAATRRLFDKPASKLALPEAALIAGLPRNPTGYDPFTYPEEALRRRAIVLNAMVDMGVISKTEAERAKNAPIGVTSKRRIGLAPYFVEEVRKECVKNWGSAILYKNGVSIYTTLDTDLQKIAEEVTREELAKLTSMYNIEETEEESLEVALLAMDPSTGEIKAMVGGRNFVRSMWNRAVQAIRQPGSAFKPFTWAAAIEGDYTPASIVLDGPVVIDVNDSTYAPHNYDHKFLGNSTLRKGLAKSRNLVAVKLILDVTPAKVVDVASRMGITTPLLPVISLTLGSNSCKLVDMVSAYATFANRGIYVEPEMIKKIVARDGNILYETAPTKRRALSPQVAYVVTSMMGSVLEEGTGVGARSLGFNRPAAGKTGTTDNYTDAWFIGFAPSLVCGVWVGFDRMRRIAEGAEGAVIALPIWTEFMKRALQGKPIEDFRRPPGIIERKICEDTGLLAAEHCTNVREEIFIKGREPKKICDAHTPPTKEKTKDFIEFEKIDSEALKRGDL
jgi:1A family penicillin-binding protein